MIQRLQFIVEVILHDSVFPLMQFYFRAAKGRSGSPSKFIDGIFAVQQLSYAVADVGKAVEALKARLKTEGQRGRRPIHSNPCPEILLDLGRVAWSLGQQSKLGEFCMQLLSRRRSGPLRVREFPRVCLLEDYEGGQQRLESHYDWLRLLVA